ncbi:MAG: hypothetical protein J1E40_13395 [Oscillospiraceae bacterium]|nr:hypothetical protein [Oscillospiraceae bacterium]
MKPSIKIISAVLALLCAAVMTSCGNKEPDVMPGETSGTTAAEAISGGTSASEEYPELEWLSIEAEKKLREDYKKLIEETYDKRIGYNIPIRYYYGTYSNGEVVVMDTYYGATADENHFSVGEYDFYLPSGSYKMTLHMGSEFIPIGEAYEAGYVTDDDAAKIYYYSKNSEFTRPVPEPLTEKADKKLRADYMRSISRGPAKLLPSLYADEAYIVEYYGTYDSGEVVVMHRKGRPMTCDIRKYSVAGYDFSLSSGSYSLTLHNGSTFIPFEEAYESGLLSYSDITKIHYHSYFLFG